MSGMQMTRPDCTLYCPVGCASPVPTGDPGVLGTGLVSCHHWSNFRAVFQLCTLIRDQNQTLNVALVATLLFVYFILLFGLNVAEEGYRYEPLGLVQQHGEPHRQIQ